MEHAARQASVLDAVVCLEAHFQPQRGTHLKSQVFYYRWWQRRSCTYLIDVFRCSCKVHPVL